MLETNGGNAREEAEEPVKQLPSPPSSPPPPLQSPFQSDDWENTMAVLRQVVNCAGSMVAGSSPLALCGKAMHCGHGHVCGCVVHTQGARNLCMCRQCDQDFAAKEKSRWHHLEEVRVGGRRVRVGCG